LKPFVCIINFFNPVTVTAEDAAMLGPNAVTSQFPNGEKDVGKNILENVKKTFIK